MPFEDYLIRRWHYEACQVQFDQEVYFDEDIQEVEEHSVTMRDNDSEEKETFYHIHLHVDLFHHTAINEYCEEPLALSLSPNKLESEILDYAREALHEYLQRD